MNNMPDTGENTIFYHSGALCIGRPTDINCKHIGQLESRGVHLWCLQTWHLHIETEALGLSHQTSVFRDVALTDFYLKPWRSGVEPCLVMPLESTLRGQLKHQKVQDPRPLWLIINKTSMSIYKSKQATVTTSLAASRVLKQEGLCGFLNRFLLGFGGLDGSKDGLFAFWFCVMYHGFINRDSE